MECGLELPKKVSRQDSTRPEEQLTPLMIAARGGDLERCAALIKQGADVNARWTRPAGSAAFPKRHFGFFPPRPQVGPTALLLAARAGHADICTLLVNAGADWKIISEQQKTPLMVAAQHGHRAACAALLAAGAGVNGGVAPDHEGFRYELDDEGDSSGLRSTALFSAASAGHSGVCALLVNAGGSLNTLSETRMTPLMVAALYGHRAACAVLLRAGAPVNTVSTPMIRWKFPSQFSALLLAAFAGHTEVCSLLLHWGADLVGTTTAGISPLMVAAKAGQSETCMFLLAMGANVNTILDGYGTALMQAAQQGHAVTCEMLVNAGADVALSVNMPQRGTYESKAMTALMLGARNGHVAVCEVLLRANADPSQTLFTGDSMPYTALGLCVETIVSTPGGRNNERLKICLSLIKAGFDHSITAGGRPILWFAARHGLRELSQALVEAGANVDAGGSMKARLHYHRTLLGGAQEFIRATALAIAAFQGHIEVCRTLLSAGADVNRVVKGDGRTPLMLAAQNADLKMCSFLVIEHNAAVNASRGGSVSTALIAAIAKKNEKAPEIVEFLLKAGADVNFRVEGHPSPLMLAVKHNSNCVDMLLRAGSDVNHTVGSSYAREHDEAQSAIAMATKLGKTELCYRLLAYGADPNKGDAFREAVAKLHTDPPTYTALCHALVECGADPSAFDHTRTSCLIEAVERNEADTAEVLLRCGSDVSRARPGPLFFVHYVPRAETPISLAQDDRMLLRLLSEEGCRCEEVIV